MTEDPRLTDWRRGYRARLRALHQLVVDTPGIRTVDVVASYAPPDPDLSGYPTHVTIQQSLKKLENDGLLYSRTDRVGTRWYSVADPEEPDDDEED
jgi:hypothetical protein